MTEAMQQIEVTQEETQPHPTGDGAQAKKALREFRQMSPRGVTFEPVPMEAMDIDDWLGQ
ncbi:hypothetical protein U1Q18_023733, partial [Sarracenia purpurea var. burkii]